MKGLTRTAMVLSAVAVVLSNAMLIINILNLRKAKKVKKTS